MKIINLLFFFVLAFFAYKKIFLSDSKENILSNNGFIEYNSYPVTPLINKAIRDGEKKFNLKVCNGNSNQKIAVPEEFKVCPNGNKPYKKIINLI